MPAIMAIFAAAPPSTRAFRGLLLGSLLAACGPPPPVEGAWSGEVTRLEGAGLSLCSAGGCAPAAVGATFPAGATLRTDGATLGALKLSDGSSLLLDRDSELLLDSQAPRAARLSRGELVAEIAPQPGSRAQFVLPQGRVEVLGTRLALEADALGSAVGVLRGSVSVSPPAGAPLRVEAGSEATLDRAGRATVAPRTSWDDLAAFATEETADLVGLGELRARRPGKSDEAAQDLALARHAVKVRVSGLVARTEIQEVFQNDSAEELEGIYRFPLPPDAAIESLTLEVDGAPVEGAFVERDRGAAIWRGVIANAAPKAPKPKEEIIWVPGPWRDPALLEWERGGRFELRIFPIPAHGSRTISIAYTQVVPESGGLRRYSYPLAHDAAGTTKVGEFTVDLQVLGHDPEVGVASRGYALQAEPAAEGAVKLGYTARDFSPSGDLSVAYALPDRDREATAWSWAGDLGQGGPAELQDPSAFVALSLRPALNGGAEARQDHQAVIVVDSSRSMVGERYARARALTAQIIREMDRRDTVRVLACDERCVAFSPEPASPGEATALAVDDFLSTISPEGGSDLAGALRAASVGAAERPAALRVLLLSDGTPTVGPTRPATLEAAAAGALPVDASVIAVALGVDADTASLSAVARGGGGVVVPYVPGRSVEAAALGALSASYGAVLAQPTLELPPGLHALTPASLDPILAGQERLVYARMDAGQELVEGDAVLRGTLAGQPYERRIPLKVVETRWQGNAFVPRLYAAARIAELDAAGRAEDVPTIVAWSKRLRVASRHTSLLVLESEAMFDAFGLDRVASAPLFTGEQEGLAEGAELASALAEIAPADEEKTVITADSFGDEAALGGLGGLIGGKSLSVTGSAGLGTRGAAMGGGGSAESAASIGALSTMGRGSNDNMNWREDRDDSLMKEKDAARQQAPARPARETAQRSRPRTFIPMRKVWDRKATVLSSRADAETLARAASEARAALAASPDSRDRTVALYRILSATGQLAEAARLLQQWSSRDALDGEALLARSDLAGRMGDRDASLRILGGIADARPDEAWLHERLADSLLALGRGEQSCSHRIALAELRADRAVEQGRALRCAREQGWLRLAEVLRAGMPDALREAAEREALNPLSPPAASGDLVVNARWTEPVDLDVALIDDEGRRLSWYSSTARRGRASAVLGDAAGKETGRFASLRAGTYALEVSRADGGRAPVSGELDLELPGGGRATLPFSTREGRAEAGLLRVSFSSRLVEDTTQARRVESVPW